VSNSSKKSTCQPLTTVACSSLTDASGTGWEQAETKTASVMMDEIGFIQSPRLGGLKNFWV
jgi:hypothetical protein